jgi:hypothetical protein
VRKSGHPEREKSIILKWLLGKKFFKEWEVEGWYRLD